MKQQKRIYAGYNQILANEQQIQKRIQAVYLRKLTSSSV